jgi:hypothetical protein
MLSRRQGWFLFDAREETQRNGCRSQATEGRDQGGASDALTQGGCLEWAGYGSSKLSVERL